VDERSLKSLLGHVAAGKLKPSAALKRLRTLPFESLGFAHVDHHRQLRQGAAEVVMARGKTPLQVATIAQALARRSRNVLITRAERSTWLAVKRKLPSAEFHSVSGVIRLFRDRSIIGKGTVLVVSAGTSDIPVAEEARLTAEIMGSRVESLYDVGVAGVHRLLHHHEILSEARIVIVVAGMEGALPSVVGGLVAAPVIAVPTSVGYGASFGGLAALLGMLNSCASNVTVVNIDNGFGAGYVAAIMNRL
jgi:NCAIR mutase (PurE)-related protein